MMTESTTILVVDDEQRLRDVVRSYLEQAGYTVLLAETGPAALEQTQHHHPDVIVLDLLLPGLDGLEVCRRLRTFSNAYVLMLTAKAEELDRVVGLEVGADDYLTKPFSPRELVARVRALLRRPRLESAPAAHPEHPPPQQIGALCIDHGRYEVTLHGTVVALTPLEFTLLTTLSTHPGLVFTRAQLLERVWGSDYFGDDHVLDVHIANLRKKLDDDPARPRYIETVRGVGYRFARERR
jgi:two-component system, OmpR family, alkaline phosphatase synthesis response regulator PhoP